MNGITYIIAKYVQQATLIYNGSSRRDVYSNLTFVSIILVDSPDSISVIALSSPTIKEIAEFYIKWSIFRYKNFRLAN